MKTILYYVLFYINLYCIIILYCITLYPHSIIFLSLCFLLAGSVYGVVGDPIPQGTGTILYTALNCTGVEQSIANCSTGASTASCTHAMDVFVTCRSERMLLNRNSTSFGGAVLITF